MAMRRVTCTQKGHYRIITALGGAWGETSKEHAILDIQSNLHRYYVQDRAGRTADVEIVRGIDGDYLRTDQSATCSDNLGSLPDC